MYLKNLAKGDVDLRDIKDQRRTTVSEVISGHSF